MQINPSKRPWIRQINQGVRYKKESSSFYHSKEWKATRFSFIQGKTKANDGTMLSNEYCIQCYNNSKVRELMHTADHIVQIEEGGSRTDHSNLQSLCKRCHAIKSAQEANKAK